MIVSGDKSYYDIQLAYNKTRDSNVQSPSQQGGDHRCASGVRTTQSDPAEVEDIHSDASGLHRQVHRNDPSEERPSS